MGVYCLMSGSSYSEVDYSDLVVKETGIMTCTPCDCCTLPKPKSGFSFTRLKAVRAGRTRHILHSGIQLLRPRKFGAAVKVNVPSGWYIKTAQRPTGPWRWVIPSPSQAGCFDFCI